MTRHRWNENDACANCGTVRSGYGGGRTGQLTYYTAEGEAKSRAGSCVPPSPMLLETARLRSMGANLSPVERSC